jgi:hypothetical protein
MRHACNLPDSADLMILFDKRRIVSVIRQVFLRNELEVSLFSVLMNIPLLVLVVAALP